MTTLIIKENTNTFNVGSKNHQLNVKSSFTKIKYKYKKVK